MSLKAIAFRILIEPDPVEETTKSGIVLAINKVQEQGATVTGTIVDIGPDAWAAYKPSEKFAGLMVGDHVYFAKYAGKWVTDFETGKEYLAINDDDIVCRFSDV
jgi:co-chaperonin GroES (HSP10)